MSPLRHYVRLRLAYILILYHCSREGSIYLEEALHMRLFADIVDVLLLYYLPKKLRAIWGIYIFKPPLFTLTGKEGYIRLLVIMLKNNYINTILYMLELLSKIYRGIATS